MKRTLTLITAALALASTAALAQPNMSASGEMPFAETTVNAATTPPLARDAVRAGASARDLEVGDVSRPAAPEAASATESTPRLAAPKSQPLSGERA